MGCVARRGRRLRCLDGDRVGVLHAALLAGEQRGGRLRQVAAFHDKLTDPPDASHPRVVNRFSCGGRFLWWGGCCWWLLLLLSLLLLLFLRLVATPDFGAKSAPAVARSCWCW